MSSRKAILLWLFLASFSLYLAACQSPQTATPEPIIAPTQTPSPIPSPTAAPRSLVICLGQEPPTLYMYGSSARSMWSVLEAIYDGPFDTRQFSTQPIILQKIPAFADGDAVIQPVDVKLGDQVQNASGDLVILEPGIEIMPSGCNSTDCTLTWDGSAPVKMDQMALTYKLLPGITWSDGAALTAADSIYSYQIASDPATPVNRAVLYRTASYEAPDDLTVIWKGRPGYIPQKFETLFWSPLPGHLLKSYTALQMQTLEETTRKPVGWGPYTLTEWVAGDHITLNRNPAYFRASEGLPKFDTLVYRFLGEPADNNIAALLVGECDVVDQTSLLDEQLEEILELQQANKLKASVAQGPEWEHLDFGIKHISYDDGYNFFSDDRPDFFGDLRMRQAFTYCLNRQWVIEDLFNNQSSIPPAYLPPSHPMFDPGLGVIPFDPSAGRALLEAVGWGDLDGDPTTPLTAISVANILPGTPLSVHYYTTEARLRKEVTQILAASLAECGIQVQVHYLTPGELFAPGPEGILFGRKFDLAEFSWETGSVPPCNFYESSQIPTAENNWLTVNMTGYSNPDYDKACRNARSVRPDQQEIAIQRQKNMQGLFAAELPVVPLFYKLKIAAARPDFCGLEVDATSRSALWNLETYDYGSSCP